MLLSMADDAYKLEDVAKAAGVSARTVRYYVQRGLLPAPTFRGKDSSYGREHLARLKAIRRLQDAFLPLDAIQAELARRSLAEIERLADGRDAFVRPITLPPPPQPRVQVPVTRTTRRTTLAPGLDLELADDASSEARALHDRILALLRGTTAR
jgi:DNA-binding transcriptional MerR regulator